MRKSVLAQTRGAFMVDTPDIQFFDELFDWLE